MLMNLNSKNHGIHFIINYKTISQKMKFKSNLNILGYSYYTKWLRLTNQIEYLVQYFR